MCGVVCGHVIAWLNNILCYLCDALGLPDFILTHVSKFYIIAMYE